MSKGIVFQIMPQSVELPGELLVKSLIAIPALGLREGDISIGWARVPKDYGQVWFEITLGDKQSWSDTQLHMLLGAIFLFVKDNRKDREIDVLVITLEEYQDQWFDLGKRFEARPLRKRNAQMGFPVGGLNLDEREED